LSNATFVDTVVNNGRIHTGDSSNSVFFGTVSGAGTFSGSGRVLFEGGYQPGNSPALINFGGDLQLGDANTLVIELAGIQPGTEYDKLVVAGVLSLAGVLDLQLLSGFNPVNGDAFDIFDATAFSGAFAQYLLPHLNPGLSWDISGLNTSGTVQVIPEPASALLVAIGLLGMARHGSRRRNT
jgi:hypothetical protein